MIEYLINQICYLGKGYWMLHFIAREDKQMWGFAKLDSLDERSFERNRTQNQITGRSQMRNNAVILLILLQYRSPTFENFVDSSPKCKRNLLVNIARILLQVLSTYVSIFGNLALISFQQLKENRKQINNVESILILSKMYSMMLESNDSTYHMQ